MKLLIVLASFLFFQASAFSVPSETQANSEDYEIHKAKRKFVHKPQRKYLKHKAVQKRTQLKKDHTGPVKK